MALINCGECQARISDQAVACPKCGHPRETGTAPTQPSPQPPADCSPIRSAAESEQAAPVARDASAQAQGAQPPASSPVAPGKAGMSTAGQVFLILVLLGLLAVVGVAIGGYFWIRTRDRGAVGAIGDAIRQPQVVVSERIQLSEGNAMSYGFTLPSDRRVQVTVDATPKAVDVMLMTDADWASYERASGKLFGGRYSYRQALSRESILHMDQSEILPAGTWRIAVRRPQEALLFPSDTAVTIRIVSF